MSPPGRGSNSIALDRGRSFFVQLEHHTYHQLSAHLLHRDHAKNELLLVNTCCLFGQLCSWCGPAKLSLVSPELPLRAHLPTSEGRTAELAVGLMLMVLIAGFKPRQFILLRQIATYVVTG